MARIGILGAGAIAEAMVTTIAPLEHEILISERNGTVSYRLAAAWPSVEIADNEAVVSDSDIVLVCLLADVARKILPDLPFRSDHAVISVMAGVDLEEVQRLGAPAPDCSIAIPLLCMPLGGTPLAVFPASSAQNIVFGDRVSYTPCLNKNALNAYFAATGMLLPILDLMVAVADWMSPFTGDEQAAQSYVAGLLQSQCAAVDPANGKGIARFQAGLATPGGLNFTLSQALKQAQAVPALQNGLDGLRKRLGLPPA